MRAVGERIRTLLEKKGMTQKQLAHAAGCTEAAVSHYVKGDRTTRSGCDGKDCCCSWNDNGFSG